MKITGYESEWVILKELGSRIKQYRIALDITQIDLARKCGISISTETRIENGDDSKMSNYIKIMTALGIIDNINLLIPEEQPDYKAIYEERPSRKRATKRRQKNAWVWEEDK